MVMVVVRTRAELWLLLLPSTGRLSSSLLQKDTPHLLRIGTKVVRLALIERHEIVWRQQPATGRALFALPSTRRGARSTSITSARSLCAE